jgi:hypothetical protein
MNLIETINECGRQFVQFAWPMLAQSTVLLIVAVVVLPMARGQTTGKEAASAAGTNSVASNSVSRICASALTNLTKDLAALAERFPVLEGVSSARIDGSFQPPLYQTLTFEKKVHYDSTPDSDMVQSAKTYTVGEGGIRIEVSMLALPAMLESSKYPLPVGQGRDQLYLVYDLKENPVDPAMEQAVKNTLEKQVEWLRAELSTNSAAQGTNAHAASGKAVESAAERVVRLKAEIARLETGCVPTNGTSRADVESKFGAGKPASNSMVPPPGGIPADSPYRSYAFCTNGTLFVRFDKTWHLEWAFYINPFQVNNRTGNFSTVKPEEELGELEPRLLQMKQIAAEYEKRFGGNAQVQPEPEPQAIQPVAHEALLAALKEMEMARSEQRSSWTLMTNFVVQFPLSQQLQAVAYALREDKCARSAVDLMYESPPLRDRRLAPFLDRTIRRASGEDLFRVLLVVNEFPPDQALIAPLLEQAIEDTYANFTSFFADGHREELYDSVFGQAAYALHRISNGRIGSPDYRDLNAMTADRKTLIKAWRHTWNVEQNLPNSASEAAVSNPTQREVLALTDTVRQNKSPNSRDSAIGALGDIGPSAREAIPWLLPFVTNAVVVRADAETALVAIAALGRIHADPTRVVPVLITALSNPSHVVRLRAIEALQAFGQEAQAALLALLKVYNAHEDSSGYAGPRFDLSASAAKAIKAIDPETASKAGITNAP